MSIVSKLNFNWNTKKLSTANILGNTVRVGRQYQYLYEYPEYKGSEQGRNIVLTVKDYGLAGIKFPKVSLNNVEGVSISTYEGYLGFASGNLTALQKPEFALEDLADVDIDSYTDTYVVTYTVHPLTEVGVWNLLPEAYSLQTLSDVDYRAVPSAHKQVLRNITTSELNNPSPSSRKGIATTDPFSIEFDREPVLSASMNANSNAVFGYKLPTFTLSLAEGESSVTLDTRLYDVFYINTVNDFLDVSFITDLSANTQFKHLIVRGSSYIRFNYPVVQLENGYLPSKIGEVKSFNLSISPEKLIVMNKGVNFE